MSPSSTPTRAPIRASASARFTETVVFPTPPLPAPTAITFFTPGSGGWPFAGCDAERTLEVISIVASTTPVEPGIFGIYRPVLLWPRGISERLTDEQVEAILAHELCHLRRRDNLAAALHMVVQTIFWFHPLVWWIEIGRAHV